MTDQAGRKPTLSAPQEAALAALLSGATVTEAAKAADVTRQTVSGWINQNADFIAEYRNRRAELWDAARARIEALIPKALDTLADLLSHPIWNARLGAASRILAPVFDKDHVPPRETTPEAVRRDQVRAQSQAARMEALLDSLA